MERLSAVEEEVDHVRRLVQDCLLSSLWALPVASPAVSCWVNVYNKLRGCVCIVSSVLQVGIPCWKEPSLKKEEAPTILLPGVQAI